jgi:hypothetical protein
VTEAIFDAAVQTRRAASLTDLALAVSVQDAGERPDPEAVQHFFQTVVIRVYDRGRGYRNLRSVRIELMDILEPRKLKQNVASGLDVGVLSVEYNDRTGHRWDSPLAVEYEALSYTYRILKKEGVR